MEYSEVIKKLNELIESIELAEQQLGKEPEIKIEDENIDYTEQYLKSEEIKKTNANKPENLKQEFKRIVEESIKQLEDEKQKLEQEIEDKLSNTEDYNAIYLVSELQAKINSINDKIKGIKEVSEKETKREELGTLDDEKLVEEYSKLEEKRQQLEKDIESKINENDYTSQYLLGNTQAELNKINNRLKTLKKYKIDEKYKNKIEEIDKTNSETIQEKKLHTKKSDSTREQPETIVVEGPTKSDNGPHKETDASDVLASIEKALEELNSPKTQNSGIATKHQVVTNAEPVKKKESQAQKDNTPVKPSQTLEESNEGAISVEPNEFFKDSNSEPYRKAKEYLPNKIQQIKCFISNGKLFYTIVGKNEEDKQFITSIEAVPKRLTRQEKRSLAKKMDKYGIENIDPQIYRILREDPLFRNTGLLVDYMEQINRLSSIDNNSKEDDMKICYDLQDLRSAKLGFLKKSQIKSIARRNYLEEIAEYIKPKSRFKTFMDRMKQKLLPAGNGNRENEYEEAKKDEIIPKQGEDMPREDRIYSTYKDLSKEDGFDFDKFCEDMELTPEERKDLESFEKVNSSAKAFHRGIKNPVEYKASSEQQQSDGKQAEKEHE